MSHHTDHVTAACCWMAQMLEAAYPNTSGVTLAAVDALKTEQTFGAAQVAYLMSIAFDAGAHARSAAERAEIDAACAANFVPAPTRAARIALRVAAMGEQHEIAWLRRYDQLPDVWEGGDAESAAARFMWDDDRPDHVPDPAVSVRVMEQGRGSLIWRDRTHD